MSEAAQSLSRTCNLPGLAASQTALRLKPSMTRSEKNGNPTYAGGIPLTDREH
jgi:hypothetical protein